MKLSLAMIVRDHHEQLERCLESCERFYDELIVAVDSRSENKERLYKIVASAGGSAFDFDWENDSFADARNASFAACDGEYIVWLDADDVVVNPAILREEIAKQLGSGHEHYTEITALLHTYNYDQDENGLPICPVDRQRVLRRGLYTWVGEVHETTRPIDEKLHKEARLAGNFDIEHDDKASTKGGRYQRVHDRLSKKQADGEEITERDLYYLAMSTAGLKNIKGADAYFDAYHEKYDRVTHPLPAVARVMHGDMLQHKLGNPQKAIEQFMWVVENHPREAVGYQRLASVYSLMASWELAIMFGEKALGKDRILQGYGIDPRSYTAHLYRSLAISHGGLSNHEESMRYAEKALEDMPDDPSIVSCRNQAGQFLNKQNAFTSWQTLYKSLKEEDDVLKMQNLVDSTPRMIKSHEFFGPFTYEKPHKKSIAFISGQRHALMDPECRAKGTGGAEESMVLQAEGLAQKGYDVTVYAFLLHDPMKKHGVTYLPLLHFQTEREYNIVILWRSPQLSKMVKNANMRILSVHDFLDEEEILECECDAVVFQTPEHARRYPRVPTPRVVPLGIIPTEYEHRSKYRDPYRCFYVSRPERGLMNLLKAWPEIKAAHPEAVLHVYTHMDALFQSWVKESPEMADLLVEIQKAIDTPSIMLHRAIGQGAIASLMASSGCWLYPTEFDENFCYNAVKAQASGCFPIVNARASLKDTVKPEFRTNFGDPFDLDAWTNHAINWIGREDQAERTALAMWANIYTMNASINGLLDIFASVEGARKQPKEFVEV